MTETRRGACDPARLSAYRDGELNPEDRQDVAAHLVACQACQDHLNAYRTIASALCEPTTAPSVSMSRAALRTRLETPLRKGWGTRPWSGVTAAGSAALAVVITIGAVGGLPWAAQGGLSASGSGLAAAVPVQAPAPPGTDTLHDGRELPGNAVAKQCAQPLPSVSYVLAQRPNVQGVLGCATDAARVLGVVSQSFERGSLVRRSDTRVVYAVTEDGRWRQYADASPSTHLVGLVDTSPGLRVQPGRTEPGRWFQGLWADRPELPRLLGDVVDGSQQSQGLLQTFEGGVALWDGRGRVFVLMSTGESLSFQDQRVAQQRSPLPPLPVPNLESSQLDESAAL